MQPSIPASCTTYHIYSTINASQVSEQCQAPTYSDSTKTKLHIAAAAFLVLMRRAAVVAVLASLLAGGVAARAAGAVTFSAKNAASSTAGGKRFRRDVGVEYSKRVLSDASSFCWKTFNQPSPSDRKPVDAVTLVVADVGGAASTTDGVITLSAQYVGNYSGNDVKTEVTGILYHETTHVWQWGLAQNYGAHPGIFEGIADYVRLKAGYAPGHWVKPGQGDRWDQGYDVTARFLDYCDSLKPGFVALLNAKLKDGYSDDFFDQILGKNVKKLWKKYKDKHA